MKIVESIMIFNEVDLLKVRLSEHYHHVDKIYIIEATETHSRIPKPLYFESARDQFDEWSDKIDYIIVDAEKYFVPIVGAGSAKFNEDFQREAVKELRPDEWNEFDYCIMIDLDEIIYDWDSIKNMMDRNIRTADIHLKFYYYFIDAEFPISSFDGNRIIRVDRSGPKTHHVFVEPIGWHFSTLGGPEKVLEKLRSERSHMRTEKYQNLQHLTNSMKGLRTFFRSKRLAGPNDYLKVHTDLSYLPQYMKDHWDVWKKYTYEEFKKTC